MLIDWAVFDVPAVEMFNNNIYNICHFIILFIFKHCFFNDFTYDYIELYM